MAKSKLAQANQKIEENVVGGYKKIEENVVGGYKKIEESVVGGFQKMTDKFVDNYLTKDGESLEEAKARISREQAEREEKSRQDMEAMRTRQEDIVRKNMEASLHAADSRKKQ